MKLVPYIYTKLSEHIYLIQFNWGMVTKDSIIRKTNLTYAKANQNFTRQATDLSYTPTVSPAKNISLLAKQSSALAKQSSALANHAGAYPGGMHRMHVHPPPPKRREL